MGNLAESFVASTLAPRFRIKIAALTQRRSTI
jgi:hypothetical protein